MNVEEIEAEETWPVRMAAWAAVGFSNGGRAPEDDVDGALHRGIRFEGEIVAVGSLIPVASPRSDQIPSWQIKGMGTLPDHQGHGYGAVLMEHFLDQVARAGGGLMWGHLRLAAVPFYERFGFRVQDDEYASRSGVLHRYGDRVVEPR